MLGAVRTFSRFCALPVFMLAVLSFCASSVRAQDYTTGLVGYWPLDEGSGSTTADTSGNGNDGTLNNSPVWNTSGKFGNALEFDFGDISYVSVPDDDTLDMTSFTLAAWIKIDTAENDAWNWYTMFEKGAAGEVNYGFGRFGDNWDSLGCYFDGGGGQEVTAAFSSTATWQHAVCTYDAATNSFKIYIDGVQAASAVTTVDPSFPANTSPLWIGGSTVWSSNAFEGVMDDARVYSRALSAADVAALYAATNTVCSNPGGFEGDMIYNSTHHVMQFCNGTEWVQIGN